MVKDLTLAPVLVSLKAAISPWDSRARNCNYLKFGPRELSRALACFLQF